MRTLALLSLAVALACCAGLTPVSAQPAKKLADSPAVDVFRQFRTLMGEGRYDLAAAVLQQFVDSNPTDEDIYTLQNRYGNTVFLSLRGVPKWSDDAALEKRTRDNVDAIIERSKLATEKKLKDAANVNKYIRNLGATFEERVYAENELRKAGEFAVPLMVDALRNATDPAITTGIINTIPKLESLTIPGWIAALDGLPGEQQYLVLNAITSRPDALLLQTSAQSDFVPNLWRIMAQTEGQIPEPPTRVYAKRALTTLGLNPDKTDPRAALVGIARTFYDRREKFSGAANNPDGATNTVPVWVWDPKANKLQKIDNVPVVQAEEYFGLRYARWVLEKDASYQPAQMLVLALSAERAVERGKFGELAQIDPNAYALLAAAPADVLYDLMDQALHGKRTALVLAITQALGDRADKGAAGPRPGPANNAVMRPSLLARALKYEDPRVQLAAANALLRSPMPVDPAIRGQIVEVLRRAAGTDQGVPGDAKGKVLLADPSQMRADATSAILRGLGYDVEVFGNGRDLLRRIARASDFDCIILDHHIVGPELIDVVGHIRADANAAKRPLLVVASADKPRPPSFEMLLLSLAVLIAATESDPAAIPAPYVQDLLTPPEIRESQRRTITARRDQGLRSMAQARLGRLLRVVESSGLVLTPSQDTLFHQRAEQVTYAVLAAEYPVSPDSAPLTFEHMLTLRKQIDEQPLVTPYAGLGLDNLMIRIERLELEVARVPEIEKRALLFRKDVDPEALGLDVRTTRDRLLEAGVAHRLRSFPGVQVIPEAYSRLGMNDDLTSAFAADPAAAPRDPAEKKAGAKIAVEWLRKMAVGEIDGFDAKPAEPELRAALMVDDLADAAIDAVSQFGSAETQQDLLNLALNPTRPLPLRVKAADATIHHIQRHDKSIPSSLFEPLGMRADAEADKELKSKLLVLKGMVATTPADYAAQLRNYIPPLTPVAPAAPMPKADPADPKQP